jgi:hypothetical protein
VATVNVGVHTDRDLEHLEREVLKLLDVGCQKTDEGMYNEGYIRGIGQRGLYTGDSRTTRAIYGGLLGAKRLTRVCTTRVIYGG